MISILSKVKGSEGFHEILDFLRTSHISYALQVNPKIYVERITQLWVNERVQEVNGEKNIHSNVYGKPNIITEDLIRTYLHLDDASGISLSLMIRCLEP